MSGQDRNDQDARPEDKDVSGLAQFEVPDPAHQQIADSQVEEAPQDIDRRGRQPHPGRGREGTLESMTRDPVAEMGQCIREESTPEKVSQVVVPAHDRLQFGIPFSRGTSSFSSKMNVGAPRHASCIVNRHFPYEFGMGSVPHNRIFEFIPYPCR